VLDWPRNEPAARRMLVLRATELDAWLRQELFAPIDRSPFCEAGGATEAAITWRVVLRALEQHAATHAGTNDPLPPIDESTQLGVALHGAITARRFTPFDSMATLASAEWLRGARLLATLGDRAAAASDSPLDPWLDAAVVLAADLRSTALLAPAIGAAELEEMVERRLAATGGPADVAALQALIVHVAAAEAVIPPAERVAERESRLVQAFVCLRARVAPFDAASADGEDDEEPPWPLVSAAGAVDRLESYDERLREVLVPAPDEAARGRYASWVAGFARELPSAAALVADPTLLEPLRDAAARLQRIRVAAQRRLESIEPAARLR
jgi:hypothetical protein